MIDKFQNTVQSQDCSQQLAPKLQLATLYTPMDYLLHMHKNSKVLLDE